MSLSSTGGAELDFRSFLDMVSSTAFSFSVVTNAAHLGAAGRSVGAHLAAKLECFGSDERTLTDELCDMLCLWLNHPGPHFISGGAPIHLDLSKTTAKQEAKNGADLRLVVSSVHGAKDCLLQAKVFDTSTGKLRGSYERLRKQLLKARNTCGSLAFLLVYVPAQHLDGASHGYGSWEQGFCKASLQGVSSGFGGTAIPVDKLLDAKGRWIDKVDKVPHSHGHFANGLTVAQLLLELMVCLRGSWRLPGNGLVLAPEGDREHFMTLSAFVSSDASWATLQDEARAAINPPRDG